jgi:hypothetical protein
MPWFKVYSTDWFAPLTSVGAAGPVLSSGGLTPVISMPAATTSVAGQLLRTGTPLTISNLQALT